MDGVSAAAGDGGGDWGFWADWFCGEVVEVGGEGNEPEASGRGSVKARGSKPGDGTLGTQTVEPALIPGQSFLT